MAVRSSAPAWRIPWTEEPRRLQSPGSPRVGRDWSDSTRCRELVSAPGQTGSWCSPRQCQGSGVGTVSLCGCQSLGSSVPSQKRRWRGL